MSSKKMKEGLWEAVFISDLHLSDKDPQIIARFKAFIDWAIENTQAVYILGDLFNVWAGDDLAPQWTQDIARDFQRLVVAGLKVYFMPGNRDFLLGASFTKQAGFQQLSDPTVIHLHDLSILLAHGDAYCLWDKVHQRFRRFTRNAWFIRLFLGLPRRFRQYLVQQIRQKSQGQRTDLQYVASQQSLDGEVLMPTAKKSIWDTVPEAVVQAMNLHQVHTLIHGHTHRPGCIKHQGTGQEYAQFILSDWDDSPTILGYNKSIGIKYIHPVVF